MFFFRIPFSAPVLLIIWFSALSDGATLLPPAEVAALRDIANTLGKKDWNFSADPCSGLQGWTSQNPAIKAFENSLTCDCSFSNNTVCHVVSIILKGQNLEGKLPPQLVRLPFLRHIDFTRNYLNGSLPPQWGSTQLVNISLIGNRLTGSIPKEFGNMTALANFTLEYNQVSGAIPPELGNLPNIERILLSSNNLTGELPVTLAKLTTLKDFRISDNFLTGRIPDFIQNWTKLEKLVIQASGLSGPIPSGISQLTKLSDLRISDLNGTEATFPPLIRLENLKTLILRSCNITGELPQYLGSMTKLKILDLSFNKLSGEIPRSYSALSNTDYIYLTGNTLSGPIPDWMRSGDKIDLSYNDFTFGNSENLRCQEGSINIFGSSSKGNTSKMVACLRSFQCQRHWHSLYINCGGGELKIDENTKFEADMDEGGPTKFFESRTNWGFSSTGQFLDDDRPSKSYIWTNNSKLDQVNNNTEQLYMNARLSPLSLTYYSFCLLNGNYTLNLHFAEIMFTDDKTYSSLGKRLFDVYVQGKLVLKDFDIANEAGGVRKEVKKEFTAVVSENTLEIRFYWAGKGTTGIPYRGVYGPLISAISLDPDFTPPSDKENGISISIPSLVGIVVAVSIFILLLCALWWKRCFCQKPETLIDLKGLDLQTGLFTLKQIKSATKDFDLANKIGEGGFGSVYKGVLPDGSVIAVKQLSSKSKQGNREFVNEIGMISALQHPHLVKLYGCCIEGNQLLLIYEYMENNSLARALFGPVETRLNLNWATRKMICIGIARGLAYLHEESRLKIVHRDIKATNVLLDKNLHPKISDFGLAKLDEEDNTHISTRIAGTYGYMAPEYAMRGYLTDKADVYSFGIVALEIVCGKSNTSCRPKDDLFYLLDWAIELKAKGNIMELVDPRLGEEVNKAEVISMVNIALLCTNESSVARPAMSAVVSMLEGTENIITEATSVSDHQTAVSIYAADSDDYHGNSDGPWTASSMSTADLYPVEFDSQYLQNRI